MGFFENLAIKSAERRQETREQLQNSRESLERARQELEAAEAQFNRLPEILDEEERRVRAEIEAHRKSVEERYHQNESNTASEKPEGEDAQETPVETEVEVDEHAKTRIAELEAKIQDAPETPRVR